MKQEVHPQYGMVVFEDASSGFRMLTGSTMTSDETTKWDDGKEYPLIRLEVSSASHPFYTGKQMLVDTAKRVDKFKARVEQAEKMSASKKKPKKEKLAEKSAKQVTKAEK